jgi:hypothetical protein
MIPLRHGPWPSINARDWLRGVWVWESTRVSAMLVSVLWIYRKMRKYRSTIVWCAGPGPRWLQSKHFDEQPWGRVRCLSDFSAGGCHVSTGIPQSLLAPDTVHIYIYTHGWPCAFVLLPCSLPRLSLNHRVWCMLLYGVGGRQVRCQSTSFRVEHDAKGHHWRWRLRPGDSVQ